MQLVCADALMQTGCARSVKHHDLATRIAMEHENSKYWARILLLFPLAPVCVALTTVVIGGVIINVATNDCNASLMSEFLLCICFHGWRSFSYPPDLRFPA